MKQKFTSFFAGIMLGAALFGGNMASAAVDYLKAIPSTHAFFVDGRQVFMAAYNIGGNNYVKLRDIGQQVGFNVYWNNGVQVESDTPHTGVKPAAEVSEPVSAQRSPAIDNEITGNMQIRQETRTGCQRGPDECGAAML